MTDFITQAIANRQLGLALHYPLLRAAVVGLDARDTFEFGAGGSTKVILEALPSVQSFHLSISTESKDQIQKHYAIDPALAWDHRQGLSQEMREILTPDSRLDLVLHDGSHAADVVAEDVAWVWPHLRCCGLLLVHDTQHSYVGAEVCADLARGLAGARFTATTLPYGFGLTIVRREDGDDLIKPAIAKSSSPHATIPREIYL